MIQTIILTINLIKSFIKNYFAKVTLYKILLKLLIIITVIMLCVAFFLIVGRLGVSGELPLFFLNHSGNPVPTPPLSAAEMADCYLELEAGIGLPTILQEFEEPIVEAFQKTENFYNKTIIGICIVTGVTVIACLIQG